MYNSRRDFDQGFIQLIDQMGDDMSVVNAARVSFNGTSKGEEQDKKLLFYLMEHGHTSPFEMVQFKWLVKAPLIVVAQWQRHRTWSYNQVSRRYTSSGMSFWFPTEFRSQDDKNKQASSDDLDKYDNSAAAAIVAETTEICEAAYHELLDLGVSREMARIVLPQNLHASMVATVNAHNLLHFIELRYSNEAQKEIRDYAMAMLEIMEETMPWTVEAFRKYRLKL